MTSLHIDELSQAVIDAAWTQWASLGSSTDSSRAAQSIIDPEALLLISLSLRHRERRLWDVLGSWAKHGSKLFSIQRIKNLQKRFPNLANDRLAEFALLAKTAGKDHRWGRLAGPAPGPTVRTHDLWKAYPSTWQPAALIIRLRLGIGVGIVADLLPFLISLKGDWATARGIAEATDYSVYSVRRTADNMAASQLIESTREKPVQYRANIEAWSDLLGIDRDLPRWRFWHKIYSLAATLIIGEETGEWEGQSRYMLSSNLRDLVEDYGEVFVLNQIEFADPRKFPGEQYLSAFADSIAHFTKWIRKSV
ncbi:MAG: hypothetical protein ACC700_14695 [Anaerolineales bacterium]